ncbi:hypothetical protein ACJMK2_017849 [Sinanodonta woodiana]|uniref:Uncharacterized protein n=1 Tax=Sinanodonta woodiana TaxID=1069815 RepID=A0ABD3UD10_SINWO
MSDKDDNNQNNNTSQSVDVIENGHSSPTDLLKNDIVSDQCVPGSPTGRDSVIYISQHPLGEGNQSPPRHFVVGSPSTNINVTETTTTATSTTTAHHSNQGEDSPHHFTNSPNAHHSPGHGSSGGATSPGHSSPPASSSTVGHGQQHVVHVHINPGETFSVRVGDQLQHIQGNVKKKYLFGRAC